jgi:RimJ/RimL family protein N-acetyltransferase
MSDEVDSSEGEFIEFKCPYCGGLTAFPAGDAGAVQGCPFCPQSFLVPPANATPAQPLPIPLATPRLTLRRLRIQDVADLAEFMGGEELVRYSEASPMDEAGIADWIEQDQASPMLQPDIVSWLGIELNETGRLIGHAAVIYKREALGAQPNREANVSLYINPALHRKGFGLEALQGLLAFGFKGINLRRITARCDSRNAAARALLIKAGLRFEGEFFQETFVKTEWVDKSYYAMLAGEYQGDRQVQTPG